MLLFIVIFYSKFSLKSVSQCPMYTFSCFASDVQVSNFWTPGLPDGVHSNRPCPSVSPSVFKYLGDCSLVFFLIFCMKLGHHKGTKVTEPDFWKKSWGVANWGNPPFLGHFWGFLSISLHPVIKIFWNFIYIISSTLSNT